MDMTDSYENNTTPEIAMDDDNSIESLLTPETDVDSDTETDVEINIETVIRSKGGILGVEVITLLASMVILIVGFTYTAVSLQNAASNINSNNVKSNQNSTNSTQVSSDSSNQ